MHLHGNKENHIFQGDKTFFSLKKLFARTLSILTTKDTSKGQGGAKNKKPRVSRRNNSYFPYCSDMQDDLNAIQNNANRAKYCSQRLLCRTLAGNNVYILTITSPASQV